MPWKIVLVAAIALMVAPHLHTAWAMSVTMNQSATEISDGGSGDGTAADVLAETKPAARVEREVLPGRPWDPYDGADAVRVFSNGSLAEVVACSRDFTLDRWTASWAGYLWITFPLNLMIVGLLIGRLWRCGTYWKVLPLRISAAELTENTRCEPRRSSHRE